MKPWRLYAPFVSDCTKGLRYAKVYKKGDNKSFSLKKDYEYPK